MNTQQAIAAAFKILQKADDRLLTKEDGVELKKLESHISKEQFGDIWSAYLTSSEELSATN